MTSTRYPIHPGASPGGPPMNHQAVSEILVVEEIELAGLRRVDLMRALRALCVNELDACLQGTLRARDLGLDCHRFDTRVGAVVATVTGWVERLGEHDVVFRIVATADGAEIIDVSMMFELVPALRPIPSTTPPANRTRELRKRDDHDARAVDASPAKALP